MSFGSWLHRAARSAGRVASAAVKLPGKGLHTAGGLVGKLPLVGTPLQASLNLASGPFDLAGKIADGARIDKAIMGTFRDQLAAVHDIAPYAQMVVGMVPGIGSGVSGAIAASIALSEGRPLDEIAMAGIKGAIPGGAAAKALFDATQRAARGENVSDALMAQIPPAARQALSTAKALARGDNVAKTALETARKNLPADMQTALDIGIAAGNGRNLQDALAKSYAQITPAQMQTLADSAKSVLAKSKGYATARNLVDKASQSGFDVGMGLMAKTGVSEKAILAVRARLTPVQQIGFDVAVSAKVGAVLGPKIPKGLKGAAAAAYVVTQGMQGGGQAQKIAMIKTIAKAPGAKAGIQAAVADVSTERSESAPWWKKLLALIGLG